MKPQVQRSVDEASATTYAKLAKALRTKFVDGTGHARSNLNHVALNLLLVKDGVRPAFMLQPVDYKAAYRNRIVDAVLKEAAKLGLGVTKIDQGIVIYKSRNVEKLLDRYSSASSDYDAQLALGKALGYPCAGDVVHHGSERAGAYISTGNGDVMANVCKGAAGLRRFKKFADKVGTYASSVGAKTEFGVFK